MKKRKLFFVIALVVVGIVMSSCRSRNPHCPGVSHYADQATSKDIK